MNLRATPEFTFIEDKSIAHGAHIASVLHSLNITPEEDEEPDVNGGSDEKDLQKEERGGGRRIPVDPDEHARRLPCTP